MTRDELRALIREVVAEATADMRTELGAAVKTAAPQPEAMFVDKGLLTERHVQAATRKSVETLRIAKSVVVTPLARDAARSKGIRIERKD